jgi:integrase
MASIKKDSISKRTATAPLSRKEAKTILTALRGDDDKKSLLLFSLGFYTGFRISDILSITWEQLRTNEIAIIEKKTNKHRTVPIKSDLRSIIDFCDTDSTNETFCFVGEKHNTGKAMTTQGANKRIKRVFDKYAIKTQNASSHTLRKTFAFNLYTQLGKDNHALIVVSKILNHQNTGITRDYLGVTHKIIDNCYELLTF